MVAHSSLLLSRRNVKIFSRENEKGLERALFFFVCCSTAGGLYAGLPAGCLPNADGGPSNVNVGLLNRASGRELMPSRASMCTHL